MVRIILHGALRRAMPGGLTSFECEARTPSEAIRALFNQHPPRAPAPGRKWVVAIAGCDSEAALHSPIAGPELHVMPAMMGAGGGSGGFIQIVVGIVLIAVSFIPGMQWAAPYLVAAGISMIAGGAISLLSPQPKLSTPDTSVPDNPEESRYLGAAGNTTKSGTRIPYGFGRYKVPGHYLHFDVEAEPAEVLGQPPSADQRRITSVRVG